MFITFKKFSTWCVFQ